MQRFVIETLTLCDGMYEVQVWEGSSGEVVWRKLALGPDELEVARGEAWRHAQRIPDPKQRIRRHVAEVVNDD